MCKKFCLCCRNVYDIEETKCPNCGFDPNELKKSKCFQMPKIEINKLSTVDLLNKEIEESPIYKATIDFEKWHAKEQKQLAEYVRKETAREILQKIDNSRLTINLALINEGYYNTADGVEIICSKIKNLIAEKYSVEVE